jgi:hypothetical protein
MSIVGKESPELYSAAFADLQDQIDIFRKGAFELNNGEIALEIPVHWALGLDLASVKTFEGAESISMWTSICSRCQATAVTRENSTCFKLDINDGVFRRVRHLDQCRTDEEGQHLKLLVPIDVDKVIPCVIHQRMRNAGSSVRF